jgi:hypothetical protein
LIEKANGPLSLTFGFQGGVNMGLIYYFISLQSVAFIIPWSYYKDELRHLIGADFIKGHGYRIGWLYA